MLIALIGLALCVWAISNGFGSSWYERLPLFVGPLGFILNIVILLIGIGFIALGLYASA